MRLMIEIDSRGTLNLIVCYDAPFGRRICNLGAVLQDSHRELRRNATLKRRT